MLNVKSRFKNALSVKKYTSSGSLLKYVKKQRSLKKRSNTVKQFSWKNTTLFPFIQCPDGDFFFENCEHKDESEREGDCVEEIATMRMSWKKVFTSGLLLYMLLWLLFFALIATVWAILFETGVLEISDESLDMYNAVYNIVAISIGVLFWLWITQNVKHFDVKIDFYIDILNNLKPMSKLLVYVVPKDKYIEDEKFEFTLCGHAVETSMQTVIHEMLILLVALMEATLYVLLNDRINMKSPKRHTIKDLHLTEALFDELKEFRPHTEMDLAENILTMYETRISELATANIITAGKEANLYKGTAIFFELLTKIQKHIYSQDYQIYTNFVVISLFIVFSFFPYVLWFHFELWTVLVYPITMLVITGVAIISSWMGDPFEGTVGSNAIDYTGMYTKTARIIYMNFARVFAPADYCYHRKPLKF